MLNSLYSILIILVLSAAPLSAEMSRPRNGDGPRVTAEQVDRAIKKGIAAVKQNLRMYRGAWGNNLGYTTIGIMSLLNAGVPATDPVVKDAIKSVLLNAPGQTRDSYGGVYNAGLVNMLLAMLNDPANQALARQMTARIRSFQVSNGGFGAPYGDYSRTQFALLGLKAAEDLGIPVDARVYSSARNYLELGQNKDGSWGYQPRSGSGYGSMTAAGITGVFIVNEQASKNTLVCGAGHADLSLKSGLNWLGERFTVETNPLSGRFHYYYLYALERIGVLTGQKFIGGHDWYREGAAYLVAEQLPDGNWNSGEGLSTEFALLFLGKGSAPVVMQKLMYGDDWNPDPYDAKDLVAQAARDLKTPMTTQVVDQTATVKELASAPILYLQGRKNFAFTPALRESIKAFIDQGGFVFASACCGAGDFDRALRTEMKIIFPDAAFEPLPDTHDIYSNRHEITNKNAFMIEGLNTGCRTAVLYAPHDICCGWSGCRGCLDKMCVSGEQAKNMGVNMIAYAVGFQHLRNKLEEFDAGTKKEAPALKRNALIIGQLYHTGDWNPDPASISNLAKTLQQQTGMKGEVARRQVALGVDDPGDYPVLYLTGHKKFQFTPAQVEVLRGYLDRGGFLLADACCGKAEFDASFRRLCEELYPTRALAAVPPDHAVLQEPFVIENIQYKPAVKALFPALGTKPQFEGISAPDGRMQVFYSRINFGCELQGHGCANCIGMKAQDAYKVAVNALLYALSH